MGKPKAINFKHNSKSHSSSKVSMQGGVEESLNPDQRNWILWLLGTSTGKFEELKVIEKQSFWVKMADWIDACDFPPQPTLNLPLQNAPEMPFHNHHHPTFM